MKQVQNVLFGAVKKVISTYTVAEFEADCKANLFKIAAAANLKTKNGNDACNLESCTTSDEK